MAVSPQGKPLGAPLNDGLLNGAEIAQLDMSHCSMVVLAACNTASGTVSQDGIIGLQTAFKKAGVQTILMTLWSVNDTATSEFMMRFSRTSLPEKPSMRPWTSPDTTSCTARISTTRSTGPRSSCSIDGSRVSRT